MITRRRMLAGSGASIAAWAVARTPVWATAIPTEAGEELVPFLDGPPAPPPAPGPWPPSEISMLDWQKLDSYITPNDGFFRVGHYNKPVIEESAFTLQLNGLVERPATFRLADLKAMPRREVVFTLECSGNHGFPWFEGGIGTASFAGTPLAPILEKAGVRSGGVEVVFYGADQGDEEVRGSAIKQNFARSMSVADAMSPHNILCWEMNGQALAVHHGFPLRLIAPGWFGIANVKWLTRIEVAPTRHMGRFMARDYVTLRELQKGGRSEWTMTSVGRALLKSIPAKVMKGASGHRIYGAAWGVPIAKVEVRVDGGPWRAAEIYEGQDQEFAWKFWRLDWNAAAGEHTITARAVDTAGNVQAAADDPWLKGKKTYWESNGQITRRIRVG